MFEHLPWPQSYEEALDQVLDLLSRYAGPEDIAQRGSDPILAARQRVEVAKFQHDHPSSISFREFISTQHINDLSGIQQFAGGGQLLESESGWTASAGTLNVKWPTFNEALIVLWKYLVEQGSLLGQGAWQDHDGGSN